MKLRQLVLSAACVAVLSACAGMSSRDASNQSALPEAVKVPSGHKVVLETVGTGRITYECRAKADTANTFEWVFVGPSAILRSRAGKSMGTYYGPPATWESDDGSKVTGTQLAVAPADAGNIPLQLVKANPASGAGAMNGISHIQRLDTRGGVAPVTACGAANLGKKETVGYQADYIFWAPL